MRIEIDKNYIVSLKTKAEYEEFSKITPWYDNLAGIPDWREYPDEGGFALRVENREIKGFDNLSNYNGYIDFRDYILITISDNSFNLVSSNSSKNLKPIVKSFDNPEVGDVYSNESGKRTVLGVAGRAIFLSGNNNKDNYNLAYTKKELIEYGYTIEGNKTEEVEEITMEELIKELGREVIIKK